MTRDDALAILRERQRELRQQYTVGFLAPNPGSGGYRSLRVEVPGKSGDSVRVRKGVEVGAGKPEPPSYAGY